MIRVVVVDDSATFRAALSAALAKDPRFQLVGFAANGREAVRLCVDQRPSLVLMDAQMPDMDGVSATRAIMFEAPCPIVVMTRLMSDGNNSIVFEALQAGAVDVMAKLDFSQEEVRKAVLSHLAAMSVVHVVRRRSGNFPRLESRVRRILIGCSTGGPPALREILSQLPSTFPAPIVIAQHLAPGFVVGMRRWLSEILALNVVVTENTVEPEPGAVYFAGDRRHLEFSNGKLATRPARDEDTAPSVDRLFESAASEAEGTVAVLLTGMGTDGANGMLRLRQLGCHTIAQDEASSLVYGMPKAAVTLGAAVETLPLVEIGPRLSQLANRFEASR